MSWESYPARESFARFATERDRLNEELYDNHSCFDDRFVGPMLKHFGKGRERLCLYRVDGCIKAAAILLPSGQGGWGTFHPAHAQITALLFSDCGVLKELFVALPGFVWNIKFYEVAPRLPPKFPIASKQRLQLSATQPNILNRTEDSILIGSNALKDSGRISSAIQISWKVRECLQS